MLIEPKHHIVNSEHFLIQLTLQIIRGAFSIAFAHHFCLFILFSLVCGTVKVSYVYRNILEVTCEKFWWGFKMRERLQ